MTTDKVRILVGPAYMCPVCERVLVSAHRHDFVKCGCANGAFVDGGTDYTRLGFMHQPPVPVNCQPHKVRDDGLAKQAPKRKTKRKAADNGHKP